jgi:hypothetical protein
MRRKRGGDSSRREYRSFGLRGKLPRGVDDGQDFKPFRGLSID